ncbi:YCF48-related protein [Pseudomonas sp. GD03860]|uniref:WD40/YVTN/BNR-like repeat-containing protein n=1 Tax=Pseudomonas TaxID=286 RepID=UPI002364329C|nr:MULTISPECIES: YCF48-related protein [Pseudomonas]MDD2058496.1 YCF48-related protein [Pseudomonas putida]MDH0640832.1 YCF48-related protein [Pseudomonas sp. GD03860]
MFEPWLRPVIALAALSCLPVQAQPAFRDPLDVAPMHSALATQAPLNAVTRAGDRLVAVGLRGSILYSDDLGTSWTQARSPSSTDLTAVYFSTPQLGWAVGHQGVVLHSSDGGLSWSRQLDGLGIGALLRQQGEAGATAPLPAEGSSDFPLLDVWFEDARRGFVVGAFNLILHTEDGGKSWSSWSSRTQNPQGLHLYSIRWADGALFIAGEQGLVLRLDAQSQRFEALATPYKGSFFNLVGTPQVVLAVGLRGTAYRSSDRGQSWHKVETGLGSSLAGGTVRADGSIVLVSLAGDVLLSRDQARSFTRLSIDRPAPYFAVADAGPAGLSLVGIRGVRLAK